MDNIQGSKKGSYSRFERRITLKTRKKVITWDLKKGSHSEL